jgi:PKD repeat protein
MFVKQSIVLLMCILLFVLCVNTASAGDGITYPSGGTINDFIFTIQASASGDIEYVRFYLHGDDNTAGVNNWKNDGFWYYQDDYSSPYGATWNMVGIPNTRYTTMIWIKYKNGSINEEPGGRVYFNAYPNSWITGNWGSCSPSCGNGNQTRTIQCVNPNGTVLPNPDKDCYGITKPDSTQSCYTYCPTYSWESDYWTSCNAPDNCGSGTQELIYKCVDDKNNTVSNSKCSGSPQTKTQSCEEVSGCVYHWEYGSWGNCSETCGNGTKTRNAFCKDQSENSVSDSKCSGTPDTTDNCTETSGCRSPVATILSIDPISSEIAETISFKGSGNDPDSGAISAYQWRSSIDGELSTQASFATSNLSVGTHTIYFKVQDDEGVWSTSVERDITINQEQCTNPEASFSTNIQTGELPLDVQFTDQSVATQDDSIVSWEWNFGDGSDSSEQHPGHIYHTAGTYTVSLKVKNSCGQDVETKMNLIVVGKSNDSDDVDLSKGLVAYYPFNGNADDESGNGNHGVVYGNIQYENGVLDKSARFDEKDYININKPDALNTVETMTISYWLKYYKPVSGSGDVYATLWDKERTLFTYAGSTLISHHLSETPESNSVSVSIPMGATIPLENQQFHLITVVVSDNKLKSYKNGEFISESDRKGVSLSKLSDNWCIGQSGSNTYYLNGNIDELRLYNRPLNSLEIKQLYKQGIKTTYPFTEIQSLLVGGYNSHIESFIINSETFIAVGNGESVKIYKWTNSSFVEYQSIETYSSSQIISFDIDGINYLAIANRGSSSNFAIDSNVYKWDGKLFDLYQSISTYDCLGLEFFSINNEHFLVVSNYRDNQNGNNVNSQIFKWSENVFQLFQNIPTKGAIRSKFFSIDEDFYLAIGNHHCSGFNQDSTIYKWSGSSFQTFQNINTSGIWDIESFKIGHEHFLAIANSFNGSSNDIDSLIYQWDGEKFINIQSILTHGASDWEYFSYNDNHYLLVANPENYFRSEQNFSPTSFLYKWSGNEFQMIQSFDLYQNYDWEYFYINNDIYLVGNASSASNGTKIYKWNYELTVEPSFQTVSNLSSSVIFKITSNNNWIATTNDSWIRIETNVDSIIVYYDANNDVKRIGKITVTAEGVADSPKIIEIRQDGIIDFENGLVAYYSFDGDTKDKFGNNDLTNNGAEFISDQGVNGCYKFSRNEADNMYISNLDLSELDINGNISISVWIKLEKMPISYNGTLPIISKWDADNNNRSFYWELIGSNGNDLRFVYSENGEHTNHVTATDTNTDKIIETDDIGEWVNFIVTTNASTKSINFYKNGLNISKVNNYADASSLYNSIADFMIGSYSSGGNYFEGFMDEIRIYNRTLSEDEILKLFEKDKYPKNISLNKGLVAYYPFNGNAKDESGNENHGVVSGAVLTEDRFSNRQKAYSFDGNSYIELPPLNFNAQLSISLWVNIQNQGNVHALISKYDGDSGVSDTNISRSFELLIHSSFDNKFYFNISENGKDTNEVIGKISPKIDTWYHVVCTFDEGLLSLFLNSSLENTFSSDFSKIYQSDIPLIIGAVVVDYPEIGALYTNGNIDDVRIYNRVLSNSEIKVLFELQPNSITITPKFIETSSASGSATFTVISNTNWTATTTAPWLTIQSNPNTITAIYEENPGETRTAIITVSAEGASLSPQYIEITQSQKENSLPEANNQEVTTSINESIIITLSATDTDNDPLTFTILTLPSNGTISNDPPNIIYTPDLDYQGVDEFTFKANDGTADSNIAHVSIQINPIPTTRHFIDVDGNPADNTWTIYLSSATLDGVDLQANDEIAIFDNETMVGSFKISEVLSDTNQLKNYLTAWSTLSDGDGYQAGHPYTFKCWDISQQKEYTCFHPILANPYEDAFTGDVFPDGDAKYSIVNLNFLTSITQTIQLSTGYRFVSLNVLPDETEMTEILSPVLDHIDFAKDSKGNLLRKIGPDWVNNIGLWKNTAGYLLRLNNNAVLNIEGLPVNPETPVDLNPGYQFVAYLLTEPTDALSAFSDILEHLDFAKDSFGNLFRKIGPNWVNNIGNLNPGEGYLLKMNAADRLFYEKPVQIQRKSYRHKDTKQVSHFGEISGNPADATWTIYLAQAQLNETHLEANDEIAIFDGNKLVGAFQLTEPLTEEKQNNHYITAWSTLNDGDGYTAGNTYTFKCWDSSAGLEYSNDELTLLNPYNDAYTDAVFPSDDANYSIATIVFSETSHKPGDMNDDGIIDLKDAVWILKMLVGME